MPRDVIGDEYYINEGRLRQDFQQAPFVLENEVDAYENVVVDGKSMNRLSYEWMISLRSNPYLGADTQLYRPYAGDGLKEIPIPATYIYNPNMEPKARYDYRTSSPDEFHIPGANANFRGVCSARHLYGHCRP